MDVVTGVSIGSAAELRRAGCLVGKAGELPVVVFWDGGRAWAIEDRCPHMGFPLHRGTVHDGLLTCHWRHAAVGAHQYHAPPRDAAAAGDDLHAQMGFVDRGIEVRAAARVRVPTHPARRQ